MSAMHCPAAPANGLTQIQQQLQILVGVMEVENVLTMSTCHLPSEICLIILMRPPAFPSFSVVVSTHEWQQMHGMLVSTRILVTMGVKVANAKDRLRWLF